MKRRSDLTLRQRHVYCLMRAYDYKNSPKMSRENFERVLREYDGARAYVFAYTGSFKVLSCSCLFNLTSHEHCVLMNA